MELFSIRIQRTFQLVSTAVGIRSFKILLYDGVPTDKIAFTEKLV